MFMSDIVLSDIMYRIIVMNLCVGSSSRAIKLFLLFIYNLPKNKSIMNRFDLIFVSIYLFVRTYILRHLSCQSLLYYLNI